LRCKKLLTALMVLLSTFPLLITVAFIIQSQYIQHQMKEALEYRQLTKITLAAKDLKWHKKGKEIIVNRHFFDVKEIIVISAGLIEVTGLYDYQEQALHKEVEGYMHQQNKSGKRQASFIQWLVCLYDNCSSTINILSVKPISLTHFPFHKLLLPETYLKIVSPPPKYYS
jgi:RNA processing factor Prp31